MNETLLLLGAASASFVASIVGVRFYRGFAARHNIVATPGTRTLHERVIPRGGGIVVAIVFVVGMLAVWAIAELPLEYVLAFAGGGAGGAGVGFFDDVYDVSAGRKFLLQLVLACWLVGSLYPSFIAPHVRAAGGLTGAMLVALALFVPIWLVNLFNFIDGIDGMAGIAAVVVASSVALVLFMTRGDRSLVLLAALLVAPVLGFLRSNLPPASIFMGDAGSMFLGCWFSGLLLITVSSGAVSIWTWLAALGYYAGDTFVTNTLRFFLVKGFWRGHRSHAYQNLARILRSHAKVTYGVAAYQLLWAVPLCIWSALRPDLGALAAALSVVPAMVWTLRFGPLFSKD